MVVDRTDEKRQLIMWKVLKAIIIVCLLMTAVYFQSRSDYTDELEGQITYLEAKVAAYKAQNQKARVILLSGDTVKSENTRLYNLFFAP